MATMEKMTGSKVKLTVEIDAERFEQATQQAYLKTAKKYNVPGFRKGKAPRKVIENMYGPLVFFDDAFDIVYPEVYSAALKENNVEPVGRPDISILELGSIAENKPVVFAAEIPVFPEVKLGKYKGIEVEKPEYNVTDEMVEEKIQQEREKVARFVDVERPVQKDDDVNLDYSGSVDGVKFDGGTAEGQNLIIGSGSFIPGFEDQMIGMNVGEEKDIKLTFPKEYHAEDLAGKEAVFHVKVNSIRVKELPELDDEFAKDVSTFDTLKELRAAKREEIEKQFAQQANTQKENEAIQKIVEKTEMDVPEAMVDRQTDYMLQDIAYRLSMQGMRLEDYCKYTGMTLDSLRAQMHDDALNRVKGQIVLGEITKAEGIKAEDDEVDAKIAEYAEQLHKSLDEVKKDLKPEDRQYFEEQIVLDKTIALIMDNVKEVKAKKTAKKNDSETAEEIKPEKKTAAKKTTKKADAEKKDAEEKKPAAKKTSAKKADSKKKETGEEA